jgi:hypothetical protein
MRVVIALVLLLALSGPDGAAADIGILGDEDDHARAGEPVRVRIACGGCPMSGLALPVALIPAGHTGGHPCRGTSCAASSIGPPAEPPYISVGIARPGREPTVSNLRFATPDAQPGLYAYTVYCGACLPGRRGSLIGHPTAHPPSANAPRPADYQGFITIEPPPRDYPAAVALVERRLSVAVGSGAALSSS